MAWEVFTGGRLQHDGPAITITSLGRMNLNKSAAQILEGQGAERVELLADRSGGYIALRPVEHRGSGTIPLKFRQNYTGITFSCVAFLNHIGYDWTVSRTFSANWMSSEVLLISLPISLLNQSVKISRAEQLRKMKQEKGATEVTP